MVYIKYVGKPVPKDAIIPLFCFYQNQCHNKHGTKFIKAYHDILGIPIYLNSIIWFRLCMSACDGWQNARISYKSSSCSRQLLEITGGYYALIEHIALSCR